MPTAGMPMSLFI
ncbi:hypothetical protein PENPOL_c039G07149 [Penicillium polonicum]|uniref:Uncharacterized protein n=1 Tax=Penicillium polonicum TaxID=60169 RepID=A0A1V6N5I5_PENPO|nr:hypothetical protein PENPOL_c039G07149 [Penicillium polonicum]